MFAPWVSMAFTQEICVSVSLRGNRYHVIKSQPFLWVFTNTFQGKWFTFSFHPSTCFCPQNPHRGLWRLANLKLVNDSITLVSLSSRPRCLVPDGSPQSGVSLLLHLRFHLWLHPLVGTLEVLWPWMSHFWPHNTETPTQCSPDISQN